MIPVMPRGGRDREASAVPYHGPLSHIPLFRGLDAEAQAALAGAFREESFEAQKVVFWTGDEGDSLFLVSEGEVVITIPNEEGEEIVLERQGPGGFFGEISLLDSGPRTATVRATEPTRVLRLSRADFHAFLRDDPDAAVEILTIMGQRQRASTDALRHLKAANLGFDRTRTTPWQRASDLIATVAASAPFTMFHVAWFGGWILLNVLAVAGVLPAALGFDPYPFGLLTMVVSLEAIFLSIFVMVSQNRQAERDRLRADLDYQVNLKAETEITALARRLDRLEKHLLGDREEPQAPTPARD
jgi:CRP/FNR family cyclic AMP-dependent transcriptional regulator